MSTAGLPTIWELVAEGAASLPEPFSRAALINWVSARRPEVGVSSIAAHIQFATANAAHTGHNPFADREPLLHRVGRGPVPAVPGGGRRGAGRRRRPLRPRRPHRVLRRDGGGARRRRPAVPQRRVRPGPRARRPLAAPVVRAQRQARPARPRRRHQPLRGADRRPVGRLPHRVGRVGGRPAGRPACSSTASPSRCTAASTSPSRCGSRWPAGARCSTSRCPGTWRESRPVRPADEAPVGRRARPGRPRPASVPWSDGTAPRPEGTRCDACAGPRTGIGPHLPMPRARRSLDRPGDDDGGRMTGLVTALLAAGRCRAAAGPARVARARPPEAVGRRAPARPERAARQRGPRCPAPTFRGSVPAEPRRSAVRIAVAEPGLRGPLFQYGGDGPGFEVDAPFAVVDDRHDRLLARPRATGSSRSRSPASTPAARSTTSTRPWSTPAATSARSSCTASPTARSATPRPSPTSPARSSTGWTARSSSCTTAPSSSGSSTPSSPARACSCRSPRRSARRGWPAGRCAPPTTRCARSRGTPAGPPSTPRRRSAAARTIAALLPQMLAVHGEPLRYLCGLRPMPELDVDADPATRPVEVRESTDGWMATLAVAPAAAGRRRGGDRRAALPRHRHRGAGRRPAARRRGPDADPPRRIGRARAPPRSTPCTAGCSSTCARPRSAT